MKAITEIRAFAIACFLISAQELAQLYLLLIDTKTAFQTIFTSFQALVLSQRKHTVLLGHKEQDKATETQVTSLSHMQTGPRNFHRVKEIAPQSHITGKFQVDIRMSPLYCFFLADAG